MTGQNNLNLSGSTQHMEHREQQSKHYKANGQVNVTMSTNLVCQGL